MGTTQSNSLVTDQHALMPDTIDDGPNFEPFIDHSKASKFSFVDPPFNGVHSLASDSSVDSPSH